jgi:hypothetical protein
MFQHISSRILSQVQVLKHYSSNYGMENKRTYWMATLSNLMVKPHNNSCANYARKL